MRTYQPEPTRATLQEIPSGPAGTRDTLRLMSRLVKQYKSALPIRELSLRVINNVRGHKNFGAQVRAIHRFVTENIQYVRDVRGVETIATPTKTLEMRAGDCDDQATLIAAMLESIGHPTRFVALRMRPLGPFVHVYTETRIGPRWVPVETTEPWTVGTHPPKFHSRMIWNN